MYSLTLLGPALLGRVLALCSKNNIWSKCPNPFYIVVAPSHHYSSPPSMQELLVCSSPPLASAWSDVLEVFGIAR
jgi:hypothetical protein